jgi:hypothetical protein
VSERVFVFRSDRNEIRRDATPDAVSTRNIRSAFSSQ